MTYEEAYKRFSELVAEYNAAINRARQYGLVYEPITSWTLEPWGSGWDIIYQPLGYRQSMQDFEISVASMEGVRTGLESDFPTPESLAVHMAGLGMELQPLPVYEGTPAYVPPSVELGTPVPAETVPVVEEAPVGAPNVISPPHEVPGWFKLLPWVIGLFALRGFLK